MSPDGAIAKWYSCSLAINLRMQPVIPFETGSRLAKPVILPMPPRNTGSRNVIRENRPCKKKRETNKQEVKVKTKYKISSLSRKKNVINIELY